MELVGGIKRCSISQCRQFIFLIPTVVLIALGLWAIAFVASEGQQAAVDDEVEQVYAEAEEVKGMAVVVTIMLIRLICNACGVYGAWKFNIYLVGLSLASYVLEAIFAMMAFSLAGLLMACFFAYPHVFFIKEVRAGIMSKENYPNEEQSCCCV